MVTRSRPPLRAGISEISRRKVQISLWRNYSQVSETGGLLLSLRSIVKPFRDWAHSLHFSHQLSCDMPVERNDTIRYSDRPN